MDADESYLDILETNNLTEEITKIQAVLRGILVRKQMAEIQKLYEQIVNDIDGGKMKVEWLSGNVSKPTVRKRTERGHSMHNERFTSRASAESRSSVSAEHKSVASVVKSSSFSKEKKTHLRGKQKGTVTKVKATKSSRLQPAGIEAHLPDSLLEVEIDDLPQCFGSAGNKNDIEDEEEESMMPFLDLVSDANRLPVNQGERECSLETEDKATAVSNFFSMEVTPEPPEPDDDEKGGDTLHLFNQQSASTKEMMVGTLTEDLGSNCNSSALPQLVCTEVQTDQSGVPYETRVSSEEEKVERFENQQPKKSSWNASSSTVADKALSSVEEPKTISVCASADPSDEIRDESLKTDSGDDQQRQLQSEPDKLPEGKEQCQTMHTTHTEETDENLPSDKQGLLDLKNSVIMELLWVQQAIVSRKNYLRMKQDIH